MKDTELRYEGYTRSSSTKLEVVDSKHQEDGVAEDIELREISSLLAF